MGKQKFRIGQKVKVPKNYSFTSGKIVGTAKSSKVGMMYRVKSPTGNISNFTSRQLKRKS